MHIIGPKSSLVTFIFICFSFVSSAQIQFDVASGDVSGDLEIKNGDLVKCKVVNFNSRNYQLVSEFNGVSISYGGDSPIENIKASELNSPILDTGEQPKSVNGSDVALDSKVTYFNALSADKREVFCEQCENTALFSEDFKIELDEIALENQDEVANWLNLYSFIPSSDEEKQVKVISKLEEEINELFEDVELVVNAQTNISLLKSQVSKRLSDLIIIPSNIRSFISNSSKLLLGINDINNVSPKELQNLVFSSSRYTTMISELNSKISQHQSELLKFKTLPNFLQYPLKLTVMENFETVTVKRRLKLIDVTSINNSDITAVADFISLLSSIYTDDFETTISSTAEGDYLSIELGIKSKIETKQLERKLTSLKLPLKGGWKINSTVGINFGNFFDGINSYSFKGDPNEEMKDEIQSKTSQSILPYLTTSVLFYQRSANALALGGNFGIGYPIDSNTNDKAGISFFLGGSVIFGKKERAILNMGLQLGKINSLDGFEEGDIVQVIDVVPTVSAYRAGYYIGFAYNLTYNQN